MSCSTTLMPENGAKQPVTGTLVTVLLRHDRGMELEPYASRCVRQGEIPELVTTDPTPRPRPAPASTASVSSDTPRSGLDLALEPESTIRFEPTSPPTTHNLSE